MAFADWKKRSNLFKSFAERSERLGIPYEEVMQAAYKAGQRDGKKQSPGCTAWLFNRRME